MQYNEVGPDYLATMGIPLVSGREFTRADDENAALVSIVNETMAAQYWRGKNPIGERLQVKGRWMLVVGVAKDSKYQSGVNGRRRPSWRRSSARIDAIARKPSLPREPARSSRGRVSYRLGVRPALIQPPPYAIDFSLPNFNVPFGIFIRVAALKNRVYSHQQESSRATLTNSRARRSPLDNLGECANVLVS